MEFSKKLAIGIAILVIVTTTYYMFVMWYKNDFMAMPNLIDNIYELAKYVAGFYFGKAAIENRIKLKKLYKVALNDEDFRKGDDFGS